jgi:hypothetical protein
MITSRYDADTGAVCQLACVGWRHVHFVCLQQCSDMPSSLVLSAVRVTVASMALRGQAALCMCDILETIQGLCWLPEAAVLWLDAEGGLICLGMTVTVAVRLHCSV